MSGLSYMKRIVSLILCVTAVLLSFVSCGNAGGSVAPGEGESIHLSQLVGVWADYQDRALYRFSPVGI